MSTKEEGISISGVHSTIAMVEAWRKQSPCAHGVVAIVAFFAAQKVECVQC